VRELKLVRVLGVRVAVNTLRLVAYVLYNNTFIAIFMQTQIKHNTIVIIMLLISN